MFVLTVHIYSVNTCFNQRSFVNVLFVSGVDKYIMILNLIQKEK